MTYVLSTEYARQFPEKEIVIVDMCPQANVSEMILGGNGKGQKNLEILHNENRTIAEYIKKRYLGGRENVVSHPGSYFIQACQYNDKLPENIYILPGDVDLDICSGIINHMGIAPTRSAWANSRRLLVELMDGFARDGVEQVFFIDCNPSFAPYTELAVIASDRLIIPCTADNASIRGMLNVFKLLFSDTDSEEMFTQFREKALEAHLSLPKVHSVLLNKSRSHEKNAAIAFKATMEELSVTLRQLQKDYKDSFSEEFLDVSNIKDGNTLAAVLNHTGAILSEVTAGTYPIYDLEATVNKSQIEAFKDDIDAAVATL